MQLYLIQRSKTSETSFPKIANDYYISIIFLKTIYKCENTLLIHTYIYYVPSFRLRPCINYMCIYVIYNIFTHRIYIL